MRVRGRSFTGIFTGLAARSETCYCPAIARPLLANATDADACTLITMSEAMKQAFGLVRRLWGVFYLKHKITGQQTSLKTSDRFEAQRILQAHNESECQPHFNLSLARVYLNGADPKLATRTWQEVMENIVAKKADETRRRWEVAIKDRNFDCIRNLRVAETRPEHFDRALADGKVSTNVYLRRIHNHALGMEWLLKRKFLNWEMRISIATCSFATGCPGLLEVLLSGHDPPGVMEFFGHLHFGQCHEFLNLGAGFGQQLIFDGAVDHDFRDTQAA